MVLGGTVNVNVGSRKNRCQPATIIFHHFAIGYPGFSLTTFTTFLKHGLWIKINSFDHIWSIPTWDRNTTPAARPHSSFHWLWYFRVWGSLRGATAHKPASFSFSAFSCAAKKIKKHLKTKGVWRQMLKRTHFKNIWGYPEMSFAARSFSFRSCSNLSR